jgi:WD40 repeat protein
MKLLVTWFMLALAPLALAADKPADGAVSFARDVAPILVKQCVSCHGPKKSKGGYKLHTFDHLMTPGSSKHAPITPGSLKKSDLFALLVTKDADDRMPKDADPLPPAQIEIIRKWIEQGAKLDGGDRTTALSTVATAAVHEAAPKAYKMPVPITALAFTPDGTRIATSGHNEVLLWHASDGKLVRRIGGVAKQTLALAFSPDGKILAVGGGVSGELGEVRLIDPATGQLIRPLATLEEVVLDVEFSPDGKQLAVAAGDQTLRIFDVATGKQTLRHDDHSDWVMAVTYSADGKHLVTASRDKTAKLLDLPSADLRRTFRDHEKQVTDACFSADNTQVYSIGTDRKLRVWDFDETPVAKGDKKKSGNVSLDLGVEPLRLRTTDKGVLVSCSDGTVKLVSPEGKKIVRTFGGGSDWLYALGYHAKSGRVAAGSYSGEVRVWNLADGATVLNFIAAPGYNPPAKSTGK